MTPYTLVLTQRKQFVTVSYGPPDLPEDLNRLVWTIDTVELDSRVKSKLFRAMREHFLGGTASTNQGALYAAPLEDLGHLVRSVLGEDVRSRRGRAVEETYEAAMAAHESDSFVAPTAQSVGYGVGQALGFGLGAAAWLCWSALRIAGWMILVPFVLGAFKHRNRRY